MKKERVLYLELLRIISSVAVVLIHVIAAVENRYEARSASWYILVACSSIFRWCIPVFFMISGSLFLNRDFDQSNIIQFLKKYVLRMLFILLIFGTVYYFFDFWVWGIPVGVKNILILPLAILTRKTGYHLWYLYPLIILYALTPLIGAVVSKLDRKYLEYFVVLCAIFCYIAGYSNTLVVQICPSLESYQIGFSFCEQMGYVGCYLIGYYLSKYNLSERQRKLLYVFSVVCLTMLAALNVLLSANCGQFTVAFSNYIGLPSVLIACSLFVLFKQIDENRLTQRAKKILCHFGSYTFGIYLFHVFFVSVIFKKVIQGCPGKHTIIVLVVWTSVVFVCSYVCSVIGRKIFPRLFGRC